MENWSERAGSTVGGLPGQLVEGEAEQVGGEELGKSLRDLGTVWKVWKMQHIRCGKRMSWKICTNIYVVFLEPIETTVEKINPYSGHNLFLILVIQTHSGCYRRPTTSRGPKDGLPNPCGEP